MNNKVLLWGAIALVVIAGVWYILSQDASAPAQGTQTGTISQNNQGGQDSTMTGTWRSTDDPKFTRTFEADGTVTDAYQGETSATETGTYTVVDPLAEPSGVFGNTPVASLAGSTILKLTFPKSGVLYFAVKSQTESSLQLMYIDRGNILSFTKVQ